MQEHVYKLSNGKIVEIETDFYVATTGITFDKILFNTGGMSMTV